LWEALKKHGENMRIPGRKLRTAPAHHYDKPQGFRISIAPSSRAVFDRICAARVADGPVDQIAPVGTFWAKCFAMVTDTCGMPWMANFAGSKAQAV
jgi:PhnB protein